MKISSKHKDGSYRPTLPLILFLALFAIVFASVGIYTLYHTAYIKSNYIKVDAVITDIQYEKHRTNGKTETREKVFVQYSIDGKTYENRLYEYSSSWDIGDTIEVYCNPANHNDVESASVGNTLGIVFTAVGLGILIIPIVLIVRTVKKNRNRKMLIENGQRVYATVIDIVVDYSIRVNNRNPLKLLLEYVDYNGVQHRFNTHNIWERMDLSYLVGMQIPMYLDRNDINNYYIDTSVIFDPEFQTSNIVYH